MFRLNTKTDLYKAFIDDLFLFLYEYNFGDRVSDENGNIYLSVDLPKLDFNRVAKAQFDLTEKAFDIIINDGTLKYGFCSCEKFGNYGDRVIEIFLQKLSKRGRYIKEVITDFPDKVYSVDEDDISGELREELIKLNA